MTVIQRTAPPSSGLTKEQEEKLTGIPSGGAENAVLTKKTATSYDDEWRLIKNNSVAAAAGIEESKLSLPEVVIKTTEQTITARKNFETPQPAEVGTGTGTLAAKPLVVKGGKGGNTSIATTGTGGSGGGVELTTGAGGEAPNTVKVSKGGGGGALALNIASGGNATTAGEVNEGGSAGTLSISVGTGGEANGATTVRNKGGKGTTTSFTSGPGGRAANGLAENLGGASGAAELKSGGGGNAVGGTKAVGGNANPVVLQGGAGGEAKEASVTNTQGKGGSVLVGLGGGGGAAPEAETGSGAFSVRYGSPEVGTIRLYVHPEGNVGIGNTSTPEAKLDVRGTTKIEGLLTAKGGATLEGTLTLPSEASTLKVAAPTAIGAYVSGTEETEAKATFVTLVITIKAEAAAGTVKLVNSGEEISFKWDGVALGSQRVPLNLMVKKAGKWKATLEGAAEKAEISRVTMEP